MKKERLYLVLLTLISLSPLFGDSWDAMVPKHNRGTLEEIPFSDLPERLSMPMEEILAPDSEDGPGVSSNLNYTRYAMEQGRAFRQTIENTKIEVYRIVLKYCQEDQEDDYYPYQKIYIKDDEGNFYSCYEDFIFCPSAFQFGASALHGIMLIVRNGQLDGLFISTLWFLCLDEESLMDEIISFNEILNQRDFSSISGPYNRLLKRKNKGTAKVYFFNEDKMPITENTKPDISIQASEPLFDDCDPFRYTIQNAFDQNPATSYVEDTEDDLMEVKLSLNDDFRKGEYLTKGGFFSQSRVINGYAKNESLYLANNRIKKDYVIFYSDNNLNYQYRDYSKIMTPEYALKVSGYNFDVLEIYHGNKYNDTCLAELDFQFPTNQWLFGGYNE